VAYRIDLSRCINCSLCRRACPTETIRYYSTGHRTHIVEPEGCIDCDLCAKVCPADCINLDPTYEPDPVLLEEAKAKARSWARRHRQQVLAARQTALAALSRLKTAS
jgi:formate hydrogenlyase subunit 6/NADH:ubiquinone oxidoreductase subunit I